MKDDADPILGSKCCLILKFNEFENEALHTYEE